MHFACMLAIVALLVPALAQPAHAQLDSTLSDEHTPFGGVDGPIRAVAIVGDELWVGGTFTTAYEADGSGASPRSNLARFSYNDGSLLAPLADVNATVNAITFDGVDTVYLGGDFTSIDGDSAPYMAAMSPFSGKVGPRFESGADGAVHDLEWHEGALFVAGEFSSWNGASGANLIRVDPGTGARIDTFDPNPQDKVWDIAIQGEFIYGAGYFFDIGPFEAPIPRRWAAGFDLATGAPAGPDLSLPPLAPGEGGHKEEARAIGASPDGTRIYVGDDRNIIRSFDVATGVEQWAYESEGDIQAIAVSDDVVFVGNHQGWFSKFDGRDLVALDPATGAVSDDWGPLLDTTDPEGILALVATDEVLIGAGEFDVINGTPALNLAVFRSASWTPADALDAPFTIGDVNCDDEISLRDALFIAQYVAGSRADATCPLGAAGDEIVLDAADVNDDGVIDNADAALLLTCAAQLCP